MRRITQDEALRGLLYLAMGVVTLGFLLRPVNDPDFFWHLKTGEWIWQHRQLPATDPFNYMTAATLQPAERFTLTAYWLCQLGYHAVHAAFGFPGILALRLALAAAIVAALLRLRRGDPAVHAALVLAALPLLYRMYPFDRPQAFSFLFFALLLGQLDRLRRGEAPAGWRALLPAPLLMLAWANVHGGHVIGQLTIVLFLALEGARFAHPSLRPPSGERYRTLLAAGGAGFLASLANPNGWRAIQVALSAPPSWFVNVEYSSSVTFFRDQHLVAIFWGLLALAALAVLAGWRAPDVTWIALLAGTGWQAFFHIRYIPFFVIAALPVIGGALPPQRVQAWGRWLAAAAACTVLVWAFREKGDWPTREGLARAMRVNEYIYPVGAADFVLASAPRGNLYNTYFWGGYLLWRLAPERRVFIDGRGLSQQAAFQSFTVNMGYANPGESPPLWARQLRQHDVGVVVIPRVDALRDVVFDPVGALRVALLGSSEWVPVFADAISLVFVRNVPEHAELIRRSGIPRERVLGWRPR